MPKRIAPADGRPKRNPDRVERYPESRFVGNETSLTRVGIWAAQAIPMLQMQQHEAERQQEHRAAGDAYQNGAQHKWGIPNAQEVFRDDPEQGVDRVNGNRDRDDFEAERDSAVRSILIGAKRLLIELDAALRASADWFASPKVVAALFASDHFLRIPVDGVVFLFIIGLDKGSGPSRYAEVTRPP